MITWTLTTTIFDRRPTVTDAGSELTRPHAVEAVVNATRSALMDARSKVTEGVGPVYALAVDQRPTLTIGTGGIRSGDLHLDGVLDHLEQFEQKHCCFDTSDPASTPGP